MSSSARPSRSTSRPRLTPTIGVLLNVSPDHLDRHGTMENYAAIKERLVAARRHRRHRRRRRLVPRHRGRACEPTAASRRPHLGRAARCRRACYADGASVVARRRRPARRAFADLAGIGSLRGAHNAQNAAAAVAVARCARRLRPRRSAPASRPSPACRTAWRRSAGSDATLFVNDSKATNADATEKALAVLRATSTGSSAASRRRAASSRSRRYFPKIAKAYLIGEASDEFAGNARATRCRYRALRHARQGGRSRPRADAAALERAGAGRAAVAGLRLLRPVPNFEVRGDALPRPRAGAARHRAGVRIASIREA